MSRNYVCLSCASLSRRSGDCCSTRRIEITHEECRYLGRLAGRPKRLAKLSLAMDRVILRDRHGRPCNGSVVPCRRFQRP